LGGSKKLAHMPLEIFFAFTRLNDDDRFKFINIGAEFTLSKVIQLRFGYDNMKREEYKVASSSGLGGFSFGIGIDVKGYNLNVYGTYLLSDQVYLDATIGYGKDSVNSKRPVYKDANSGKTFFATGKPDAKEFTFSVGGGYEFYKGEWSLTPYGRMDYTKATIDAYKETSDVSAQSGLFRFDKQNTKALTSTLGLKTSRSLSTSKGVFVPYASLEWKHEFKGRGAITGTHLLTGKQTPVGETSKFDRNYYNLGVGISAQFPKGKAAFLSFESRQGDSVVKDNAVKAGFRWEF
jgi:outer membrane autotransporter protein